MNCSQFISQVQNLMHMQQINHSECKRTNYAWLSSKKCVLTFMTAKEEFLLRHAIEKVNQEQRIKVMQQLLSWLNEYPNMHVKKIPETCVSLLNKFHTINVISEITLSRKNTFRKSLKRFSLTSNKISPQSTIMESPETSQRCVKFNDNLVVYCISD